MKKFIILISIFYLQLFANGSPLVVKSFYTNKSISVDNIAQYASKFKAKTQDEKDVEFEVILFDSEDKSTLKQDTKKRYTWIMLELDKSLRSGQYWVEHTDFEFTEHTFKTQQSLNKFSLLGRKIFSFNYNKSEDSKRYFLKVVPRLSHVVAKASIYTPKSFSAWASGYSSQILLYFFLFGTIFMAAIYNGALYLYNREKSFLYYMVMQIFMVGILIYQTDIVQVYTMGDAEDEEIAIFLYFIFVELAIIFILYFIREFLETKKYLPLHDKILKYITIFAFIDLILFFVPIMLILKLYSFVLLYVVAVAWMRFRQGYKPALFFIIGWSALMIGVFVSDFLEEQYQDIQPILIGSTIEALFLAVAISYKMRQLKNEKEEQKELLVHQSRLASMGDLLGNIAHQWRQPLSRLGYILMNIESKDKDGNHTKKLEEAFIQLEFMSQTIDDFKDFYKPYNKKESFNLLQEAKKVLALLDLKNIQIRFNSRDNLTIYNHKNGYKQVLLNILTNAKEAFGERSIDLPRIDIIIEDKSVTIIDNAGGISSNNIKRVFEPYFSTKEKGLGIGLYMSKVIVERNLGGVISVKNYDNGAFFKFTFKII